MPSTRLYRLLVPCLISLLTCCLSSAVGAEETHVLASQISSGDVTRVTAQLEVGGDLKLVSEGKVKPVPMSVVAHLAYDELLFTAEAKGEHLSSLRYYERAEATIKIEQGGAKPSLRETHRLIGADWGSAGITLFSPQGPLKRDELDLLMLPANSLLLDALLPAEPVSIGGTWKHSEPLLAALLDLDAVSTSDVQSTLKNVQPQRSATLELAGKLEGAIHGVSTKIELKGRYTYDFARKRITNLVLLVNEDRSIGHVATGLDVTSKITLSISPLTHSEQLSLDKVEQVTFEADPARNPLLHESIAGGYRMFLDRRWHSVHDEAKLLTLRFVDRGDLLAQCNIAPLEKASPGQRVSLQKFQADIREALKDSYGQFLRASEGTDSRGRTIYSVIANGRVSDLPIQWNYYLVADREGHQVAFAFTLEEGLVERFGDTDRKLVGSLEFFDPPVATAEPTPAAQDDKVTRGQGDKVRN
jgi:hypothetical protein